MKCFTEGYIYIIAPEATLYTYVCVCDVYIYTHTRVCVCLSVVIITCIGTHLTLLNTKRPMYACWDSTGNTLIEIN